MNGAIWQFFQDLGVPQFNIMGGRELQGMW